ncbi:MAG TPA: VWA domain-containing protein [Bryobacteraceae bacterium]|nr:VWA domain-containing protein [Bryobacteraceae bacterium]
MRILAAFTLAGALFAQAPQSSQAVPPADEVPLITADVDVVSILAAVRDKHNGLVSDLGKGDFTIMEDGKPQTIKYFTRETDLPLTIGLLIDVSRSQENVLDIERRAAAAFFTQVLQKKDEAFLISFGEESELLQDFTNSPRLLTNAMNGLKVSSGVGGLGPGPVPTLGGAAGTVLYDAIYLASNEKLKGEVGRKVIVVITDGVDEGSKLKIEDALEAAQKADTVIYSIDYSDASAYGGFSFGSLGGGYGALKRMSEETGGHVFEVDRKHTLDDVFKELQEEMRSQYSIGYTPINDVKDGSYRKLDIRVKDKTMKVQARKGYYAIKHEAK